MGRIRHDAIVVTGWRDEDIEAAHGVARTLCADSPIEVTEITAAAVNGQRSFMLAPDGSKEGWEDSDKGDEARKAFLSWIDADYNPHFIEWVAVNFGGDEPDLLWVQGPHDDKPRRAREGEKDG